MPFPSEPVRMVWADPPWPFHDRLPGSGRGAEKHYGLMTMDEIHALLPRLEREEGLLIAEQAHLYLWVPNIFVRDAYEVAQSWGFVSKNLITWVKTRGVGLQGTRIYANLDDARVQLGMGWYFRNCTEQVVFATRGNLRTNEKGMPNVFFAPRTYHSRKPQEFYDIVERMSSGPYVELFARQPTREGWAAWGDEAGV